MKVLYYTNKDVTDKFLIPSIIESAGDVVDIVTTKPQISDVIGSGIDFIVCDRARALITPDILESLPQGVINIHPSFLPWNRGYHPNFWSIVSGTPAGTTIHYIDEGIDTGAIIAQVRAPILSTDTLRSSYERLRRMSVTLFQELWPIIRTKQVVGILQEVRSGVITHRKADFDGVFSKLRLGWDTPVSELCNFMSIGER